MAIKDSIEELIIEELIARLSTITVDEDGTPVSVNAIRTNRDASTWTPRNNTIVVVQGSSQRDPDFDCPGNPPAVAYILTVVIVAFIRQNDRETSPDATRQNEMAAEIKKAIVGGSATWHTLGGRCFDADLGNADPFPQTDDGHAGVMVEMTMRFRASEQDPYTVRA
jgi:hypothetical protein